MTPNFGLPQRSIDELHAVFARHNKVHKVVIYGSRAMGNYKQGSDIDLTLFGEGLEHQDLLNISSDLDDSNIPYLIDLSIFDWLDHAKLRAHINREGKVFYDRCADWKTVKLGDVCEIQPPKKEVKGILTDDSEVSFMGMDLLGIDKVYAESEEVRSLSAVYKSYTYFAENDVLLAKITPCFENGKLGVAQGLKNGIGFGSSEFVVFRCNEDLLPKFLYYFLNQKSFRNEGKRNMSGAVGHKRVMKKFIENTEISYPPLAEQQRIVAKLDAAFAEIDMAAALSGKNVSNAERLYAYAIDDVFGTYSDKSESIGNHSDISYGYTAKASFEKSSYKFLRITDIQDNDVDWETVPYCQVEDRKLSKMLLHDGDIVFARTGATTGKSFLVENPVNAVFASYLIRVSVDRSVLLPRYVMHYFQSARYWEQVNEGISGAAQGGFNASKLSELQIPIIGKNEQLKLVGKLDKMYLQSHLLAEIYARKLSQQSALKSAILAQELQSETA